jgi:hypothetical protein
MRWGKIFAMTAQLLSDNPKPTDRIPGSAFRLQSAKTLTQLLFNEAGYWCSSNRFKGQTDRLAPDARKTNDEIAWPIPVESPLNLGGILCSRKERCNRKSYDQARIH